MEEQKKDNKVVEMKVAKGANQKEQEQEKLSYEKLNSIAVQLYNENQQLKQRVHDMTEALKVVNRMDYLLKIIEIDYNSRHYKATFGLDFVQSCINEVQELMTLPKSEESEKQEEENTKEKES